ncbi:hypothetical protein COCON_G00224740 [Conger conger]|uniref:Coiled-coil-helix-coiled-coil-helix domain-containing protein 1 n=1 Tax=Conger conger TaxID=82655 RepID=A0A9Q1CX86_CONCO|nr:coiled-coil-helix-coiled-coil-helix domain-containing protein 1 [Conger conger]KAJ8250552.1 hypothetical protein COCON_G00224740 [Conger conger]
MGTRGPVSRIIIKQVGKPVLKPNRPLALKNHVSTRMLDRGGATCLVELSLLMTCWKRNEFGDAACSNEIRTFNECAEKARAEKLRSNDNFAAGERLPPKLANTLLRRFPNPSKK